MSFGEGAVVHNIFNPATLSFCLGATARFIRSELVIPKEVYAALSIFLLFSIGLKGGHELSLVSFATIAAPVAATLALGVVTPLVAFGFARYLGRLSVIDSAGVAAHYGSVSVVTFMAAQSFVSERLASLAHPGTTMEGYLPTLVALLEAPGIAVALMLGVLLADRGGAGRGEARRPLGSLMHEVVTGRTMVLLVGGLVVGAVMGSKNWESVAPFFDPRGGVFRGVLCLFLLEMGMAAASRWRDITRSTFFMISFGVCVPVFNAMLGIVIGHAAGLSVGGAAVLGTMAASASYIAAPPAVRASLPEANPAIYLTLALAITFPFNIVIGIPLYLQLAQWYAAL